MKRPTIGTMVHYVMLNGTHLPAIVTATFGEHSLDLVVFLSSAQSAGIATCSRKTMVPHADGALNKPETWHWPDTDPAAVEPSADNQG